jgi:hypothetical protein
MPVIYGDISSDGAVIDITVDVSRPRRRLLEKMNMPVPKPVHVRALIDTGSTTSGFSPRVFTELSIVPVDQVEIYTPSTPAGSPHKCNLYDVVLSIIAGGQANPFPGSRVIEADCWLPTEPIEALIGRDILKKCYFQYMGQDERFTLAF